MKTTKKVLFDKHILKSVLLVICYMGHLVPVRRSHSDMSITFTIKSLLSSTFTDALPTKVKTILIIITYLSCSKFHVEPLCIDAIFLVNRITGCNLTPVEMEILDH